MSKEDTLHCLSGNDNKFGKSLFPTHLVSPYGLSVWSLPVLYMCFCYCHSHVSLHKSCHFLIANLLSSPTFKLHSGLRIFFVKYHFHHIILLRNTEFLDVHRLKSLNESLLEQTFLSVLASLLSRPSTVMLAFPCLEFSLSSSLPFQNLPSLQGLDLIPFPPLRISGTQNSCDTRPHLELNCWHYLRFPLLTSLAYRPCTPWLPGKLHRGWQYILYFLESLFPILCYS